MFLIDDCGPGGQVGTTSMLSLHHLLQIASANSLSHSATERFCPGTQYRFINLVFETLQKCILMKEGRELQPTSFSCSQVWLSEQISPNFCIFCEFLGHYEQLLLLQIQGFRWGVHIDEYSNFDPYMTRSQKVVPGQGGLLFHEIKCPPVSF